jgi:diaminopimelate epimerase
VAKYAYDHGLTRAQPMRIQTRAGTRLIRYELDEHGRLALATVNMGPPELRPSAIPVRLPDLTQVVNHPMQKLLDMDDPPRWAKHCGLDARITCVSMGNPHAVLYCDVVSEVPLETVGPRIEQHSLFPERINVHFVEVRSPREAIVRHWERGSGPTLACGTGACAVCVAGVLTGRTDRRLRVHVPGGELTLEWDAASDHVMMTGPAAEVFSGEWPG